MSRLAILLGVALCAGAIQAVPTKSSANVLLDTAKHFIDDRIDKALERIHETANNVQKEAEEVVQKMKEAAAEADERIKEKTTDLTKKLDDVLAQGLTQGIDVEDCRKLLPKETIESSAKQLLLDTNICMNKNIEKGANLVRDISITTNEVVSELINIKSQYKECVSNAAGYLKVVKIGNCIATAKLKAIWAVTKRVPAFVSDKLKLSGTISHLPVDLALCSTAKGLSIFQRPFEAKLKWVERCISEQVAKKGSEQKTNEQNLTEQKTTEQNLTEQKTTEQKTTEQNLTEPNSEVSKNEITDTTEEQPTE